MEIPNSMNRDIRLPPKLYEEIKALAYSVKEEDTDLVFTIDGEEGTGKSQAARLLGAALANELGTTFGVENIHYSTQEYMESSNKLGRFSVHILDEAGVILHRGTSNARDAKRFTKFLQVARGGNNQIHIIVLPAYHLLDGYVVNWRSRFVMHMLREKQKTDDPRAPGGVKTLRGGFKLWTKCDALTYNYHLAAEKHIYKYPTINPFLMDRLPNAEALFPEEVKALQDKKEKWRTDFINDDKKVALGSAAKRAQKQVNDAIPRLSMRGLMEKEIAEVLSCTEQHVRRVLKRGSGETEPEGSF